jgi:hypothetical protein
MIEILEELRKEILTEMEGDSVAMESLGTPAHQLKTTIDGIIEELHRNKNCNPYDMTNRILSELNRYRRLKA